MGGLQRFEQRLEQLVSGVFARAFRSAVQPVEIAAALQREVDNNAQILSRNRRLVPNDFHVELSPTDLERLAPYDSAMASEITEQLRDHATAQSYVFPGPVQIAFEPAEDLTTGRFRIRSRAQAKVTGREAGDTPRAPVGRTTAQLLVNGTRHTLHAGTTVVGRGTDADIRINDPGVSRQHVEFTVSTSSTTDRPRSTTDRPRSTTDRPRSTTDRPRSTGSRLTVSVRDLGSTNGMLVDDQVLAQSPLDDGSTVRIGNTTMTLRLVTEEATHG